MVGPSAQEQYYLELINETRMDPLGNAARYISSYSPLTSASPEIKQALQYFGVSGPALLAAYSALTPVRPVAWNEQLATAARTHNGVMIAQDTQTHQATGELDLGARITAAGYQWSGLGENVYAYSSSTLFGHAGFMVDWGPGQDGMQTPAGHRINIMNAAWTEVGIGVTVETNSATSVGPQVVTEDFGTRGRIFVMGVAYNDLDKNNFYTPGEGRGDLTLTYANGTTTTWDSGGYSLDVTGQTRVALTLQGGGIVGTASVTFSALAGNAKLDVVDSHSLKLSNSASVSGFSDIYVLGVTGITVDGSAGDETFHGGAGNDIFHAGAGNDVLIGGGGSDILDGGDGIDTVVYSVARSQAVITRNANNSFAITVGGATDTVSNVEKFQFSDGLYSSRFASSGSLLVSNFSVNAGGWSSQLQFPRHIADVNGDGYNDIVGFGQAGVLVSYGSASGTFLNPSLVVSNFGQTTGWANDNQFHRELADVNGDGRADIIGFGYAGTLVSLARADGTYANPVLGVTDFGVNQGWATQDGFARAVADVNGDGKADLIGFGYAGTLVALGNGNGTFGATTVAVANFGVQQGWTSDNIYHRAVADVNGDGKADLVGFGQAGTYVALSKGDGTFGAAQLALTDFGVTQGWTTQDGLTRLLADVNGDGRADIVGFGNGVTRIAYGQADGSLSLASTDIDNFTAKQGWTSDALYHREIADINHDGLNDIVGFGIAGVIAGLNQGELWII